MISISVAHTAIASTRTRTSAASGSGTGFSTSDNSPGPPSTQAFIVRGIGYWLVRDDTSAADVIMLQSYALRRCSTKCIRAHTTLLMSVASQPPVFFWGMPSSHLRLSHRYFKKCVPWFRRMGRPARRLENGPSRRRRKPAVLQLASASANSHRVTHQ
jgi:hypothetical protein